MELPMFACLYRPTLSLLVIVSAALTGLAQNANAATGSRCIALANAAPNIQYVSLENTAIARNEVSITFVGHSTFRIETGGGVVIATDFTGYGGPGRLPDVVTMNHAHSSHYTAFPDPNIKHILRGWGEVGSPAQHSVTVGDAYIRNVTTDIRGYGGIREKDGNSIFIFEIADLCIGHLGHLHHTLGPEYLGLIGQLDIVMVPVDGGYTMEQASMVKVLELLKARLILPMHYFGQATLARFMSNMDESFDVDLHPTSTITVSFGNLPSRPKVLVLPGASFISSE
jgi:L-ascorbate metabolism protein UlaG (beta-lactamase superfamily)